ncbi:hypothetical protein GDO81_010339 [Engystomops pustulosus]|uniref:Interferon gamma n=1 Tax=Engystomops pustulosus TaxID=76066 RepID=A0AAV7BZ21_ENGPU|nr:hypothetical protein GDO81_010339 [Engystomops pustulosus]
MLKYCKIFLLYCVVLCYLGQINGYNIDLKTARNDIEKLKTYLEGEKKLLLSQIVPIYLKMLESMKDSDVKDSITNLKQMLHTSNKDYLEKTDKKIKSLNELKKMQVSDIKFQRVAIKELLRILRDVSTLQDSPKKESKKCKRENVRRKRGC